MKDRVILASISKEVGKNDDLKKAMPYHSTQKMNFRPSISTKLTSNRVERKDQFGCPVQRHQFPFRPPFAISAICQQGQTFEFIVIGLRTPVLIVVCRIWHFLLLKDNLA